MEEKGRGRVYLDFVLEIDKLARAHGKQTHIASDMLNQYPELYDEVPDDIVIMDWNYDDDAPFDTTCARIAEAGLPFCVVPGTSAWYSLGGRTDTCLANQRLASRAGRDHGAIGYVNTDWGDKGYWHYYAISEVGWAAGAAWAWNGDGDEDGFTRALDLYVYGAAAGHMGRLAYTLGNIYKVVGTTVRGASALFHLILDADETAVPDGVAAEDLKRTRASIDEVMSSLPHVRLTRDDGDLVVKEFANTGRLMRHACDRGLALLNGTMARGEVRRRLASVMDTILTDYRWLWRARNREGGLSDSARVLEERLAGYRI